MGHVAIQGDSGNRPGTLSCPAFGQGSSDLKRPRTTRTDASHCSRISFDCARQSQTTRLQGALKSEPASMSGPRDGQTTTVAHQRDRVCACVCMRRPYVKVLRPSTSWAATSSAGTARRARRGRLRCEVGGNRWKSHRDVRSSRKTIAGFDLSALA